MNEILSQDEIDQLLSAISSGQSDVDEYKPVSDTRKIKIYDFKRPDKFSKEQIRTKLRRNDFGDNVIDKVIALLEEYNLLNDYEYAKAYISSYQNKKSIRELKFELQKRGIDRDIIEELVSNIDSSEMEIANIEKIVRKYRDSEGNIPIEKRQKIMASLYRKGYDKNNILRVLDKGE